MKILLLNEMMFERGTSYTIRFDTANELAKNNYVRMITPTYKRNFLVKRIEINKTFSVLISPGILPSKFRRGGFSVMDLLYKIFVIIKFKPEIIYTTTGHRPSQLIPSLFGKYFFNSKLIDERWEYYGVGGRSSERSDFIGHIIKLYDRLLEKKSIQLFKSCICVSNKLSELLGSDRTIFYPGVIDYTNHTYYSIEESRNLLSISHKTKIIGMLSLGKLDHPDYEPFFNSLSKLMKPNEDIRIFCTGEKKYIQETLISRFGNKVLYLGWLTVDQLHLYLSACSFFILPLNDSLRNLARWPIKFNDFVFFKRPIITSCNHDISKLYKNSNLILTYDPSDYDEIDSLLMSFVYSKTKIISPSNIALLDIKEKVKFLSKIF